MDSLKSLTYTSLLLSIHTAYTASSALSRLRLSPPPSSSSALDPTSWSGSPEHVALTLVLSPSAKAALSTLARASSSPSSSSRRGSAAPLSDRKGKAKERVWEKEADAVEQTSEEVVRCLKDAVRWAQTRGVTELSLWEEDGLLHLILPQLMTFLVPRPPSPPTSSGTSSPPLSHATLSSPLLSAASETIAGNEGKVDEAKEDEREVGRESESGKVHTFTVWPDLDDVVRSEVRPLLLHVLPPPTSSISPSNPDPTPSPSTSSSQSIPNVLVTVTSRLASSPVPVEEISQAMIDGLVKEELHFDTDPSLLIIHHLTPTPCPIATTLSSLAGAATEGESLRKRSLEGLLPMQPPVLRGYPAWPLRITEIYQQPQKQIYLTTIGLSIFNRIFAFSSPTSSSPSLALSLSSRPHSFTHQPSLPRFSWQSLLTGREPDWISYSDLEKDEVDGLTELALLGGMSGRNRTEGDAEEGMHGGRSSRQRWEEWDGALQRWRGVEQRLGR